MQLLRKFLALPFHLIGLVLFGTSVFIMAFASKMEGVDRMRGLFIAIAEIVNEVRSKRVGDDENPTEASS